MFLCNKMTPVIWSCFAFISTLNFFAGCSKDFILKVLSSWIAELASKQGRNTHKGLPIHRDMNGKWCVFRNLLRFLCSFLLIGQFAFCICLQSATFAKKQLPLISGSPTNKENQCSCSNLSSTPADASLACPPSVSWRVPPFSSDLELRRFLAHAWGWISSPKHKTYVAYLIS